MVKGSVSFYFVQMVGTNLGKYEWVWEEKLRCWYLNPRWQNSRWMTSSSWVRMNEFESDWISLSQSQSGGRVFLSESERRKQGVWIPQCRSWIQDDRIQYGRNQDGHHHQDESEWMSEGFFCANSGNQSWEVWMSLRAKTKMAESKMARNQDGRIQDDCHHQVEWEWMSLSQIELVWVRVRVEGECFWVNLREENKVSESKMAEADFKVGRIQDGRIQDGHHHQVEWEWMSLSQIELVWVRVRVEGECFWVNLREDNKVSEFQDGSVWIQHGRIQDGCHHQVESEWMNEGFLCKGWGGKCEWSFFLCKWWEPILASMSEFERKN